MDVNNCWVDFVNGSGIRGVSTSYSKLLESAKTLCAEVLKSQQENCGYSSLRKFIRMRLAPAWIHLNHFFDVCIWKTICQPHMYFLAIDEFLTAGFSEWAYWHWICLIVSRMNVRSRLWNVSFVHFILQLGEWSLQCLEFNVPACTNLQGITFLT